MLIVILIFLLIVSHSELIFVFLADTAVLALDCNSETIMLSCCRLFSDAISAQILVFRTLHELLIGCADLRQSGHALLLEVVFVNIRIPLCHFYSFRTFPRYFSHVTP
jgi:hypothetical protein